MVQKARTKVEDSRKPRHSNDAERPSKGGKNLRDAATVCMRSSLLTFHCSVVPCVNALSLDMLGVAVSARVSDSGMTPQVRRLNMYKKRAKRDKKGKLIHQVPPLPVPPFPFLLLATPPQSLQAAAVPACALGADAVCSNDLFVPKYAGVPVEGAA